MRRILLLLVLLLAACHVSLAQSYTESVLYSFDQTQYDFFPNLDANGLMQASDGNFYGTTSGGGLASSGSIFKMTPDGIVTTIYNFYNQGGPFNFSSALIEAGDGNLYGFSPLGSTNPTYGGTVFRITPSGNLTVIYNFCSEGGENCTDGGSPTSLILGSDGNLYGTASGVLGGGQIIEGSGTIFRLTLSGTLTTLYSFCTYSSNNNPICPQGTYANTILEATDGNFYGSAFGASGKPTFLYEFTTTGEFKTLYTFCSQGGSKCTDGNQANGLIQATPDALYGTTLYGGSTGNGVAFKLSHAGGYQKLYDFCSVGTSPCTDGSTPAGFFQATDGKLYEVTSFGGIDGTNPYGTMGSNGTVGYLTLSGKATVLYDFCTADICDDGAIPATPPIQGSDGNFFGTTQEGGFDSDAGVIYELAVSPSLPPPVQLTITPAAITKGASATLQWSVPNAYSMTQQQCYAFINPGIPGDASYGGEWTGKQAGTLANGVFSGSTTITPTGAGTFTYALTCGGNISGFATLTVEGETSAASFSLSPTTLYVGQPITVTVTVTGAGITPTGTVTFYSGSNALQTVPLDGSGAATTTDSTGQFAAGTYNIVAKYSGDSNYNPSKSAPVTVTLEARYATTMALTASPLTIPPGQPCTFTATVTRNSGSGTPTGKVGFFVNLDSTPTLLGISKLTSSGVATLTVSSQGANPGGYSITATYYGDVSDTASTSSPVNVTLQAGNVYPVADRSDSGLAK